MKEKFIALTKFFSETLWNPMEDVQKGRRFLIQTLRVVIITTRSFILNKNGVRASALTFYAILSIVPVLAVAFGVAKGFGFDQKLEEFIATKFEGQQEVMAKLIEFSRSSLTNTNGGLVAGISILFLLWSVIKLLNHIENAFNSTWNIKKSRTFIRKFTDYLSLILIGPIFIIVSSSATVFVNGFVEGISTGSLLAELTGGFILTLMKLAPFVLIWILFTFMFMIIPNKAVKFVPALVAGIISGSAFEFLQGGYVYFQIAMSRSNAVYGSFAALPLFLIWMQISWLIILYGAEVSHAMQYAKRLVHSEQTKKLSYRYSKLICLHILHTIGSHFAEEKEAPNAESLAENLEYPIIQIEKSLEHLVNAGLISVVKNPTSKYEQFQLAIPLEKLSIASAIQRLDKAGSGQIMVRNKAFDAIKNEMIRIENIAQENDRNLLSIQF